MLAVLERDPVMLVWWAAPVECTSALARRERDGELSPADVVLSLDRLRYLKETWQEIVPSVAVRNLAERLLRVHALRAADSLQLGAAILAAEREPAALEFVSLDLRLNDAATPEGFRAVTA